MLGFMRKHQKYFYVLITIVIVVSFSFFGTYSTLGGNSIHEQVAFTTVDGEQISRSELEDMALFIGTDREDKKLFGGMWGPNFLNDGLIRKDFLDTGLAKLLIESYPEPLEADFKSRLAKEARFKPYVHPNAKYLSSMAAWNYFAPQIPVNLAILQKGNNPLSPEMVEARINLYLNEKRFSGPYLRQVLVMQERQHGAVGHDPALDQQDFSLFGYHTVEDWFGPRFTRLIAEFIFNAAAIAENQGYRVSKEEAYADLLRNAEISFKENQSSPYLGVSNSTEYYEQQLLRLRLDKTKATKLWQKVLLFRRLFGDIAQSVLVDPFSYRAFNEYANEVVKGEIYRLPASLRFSDFQSLVHFETYLDGISKRSKEEKNSLLLPKTFLTVQEVAKKNPELVRKRYEIEYASANKKNLQTQVSVKDSLNWELEDTNWQVLKTQFPELGIAKATTKEERLKTLDSLDGLTRSRIDQFARAKIVDEHPEWLKTALLLAPLETKDVSLSLSGQNTLFKGLEKGEKLMTLLDKAEINKEIPELQEITFDGENYYRIKVLKRSPELEIITFDEAAEGTALDTLSDQTLETYYVELRTQKPEEYQNADKSWKPYASVKDKVAESYYSKLLEAIKAKLIAREDGDKYKTLDPQHLAAYRFIGYAEDVQSQIQKNPETAAQLTLEEKTQKVGETLSVADQFKLIKGAFTLPRKSEYALADSEKLFKIPPNSWSKTIIAPNGDVYFAYIKERSSKDSSTDTQQEQIARARWLLGNSAERSYLTTILPELKKKNAISFEYLNINQTSLEPGQTEEEG